MKTVEEMRAYQREAQRKYRLRHPERVAEVGRNFSESTTTTFLEKSVACFANAAIR